MTYDEFDMHEPYRCYAYMILVFGCDDCEQILDSVPSGDCGNWQWCHDLADLAWRAGWYVPPRAADGSCLISCYCPECAGKRNLQTPAQRS